VKTWKDEILPEVMVIEIDKFPDDRGYFVETFQEKRYREAGIGAGFVQDNLSFSRKGVLRGLHYQYPHGQAKLVHVVQGEIFDVVVDIRKGSPRFGKWTGVILSDTNRRQLFVPVGFAHGFYVLSETAYVLYKCTDFYSPESEGGVLWCDPDLNISWPTEDPIVSPKDAGYQSLKDISEDRLPTFQGPDHSVI